MAMKKDKRRNNDLQNRGELSCSRRVAISIVLLLLQTRMHYILPLSIVIFFKNNTFAIHSHMDVLYFKTF